MPVKTLDPSEMKVLNALLAEIPKHGEFDFHKAVNSIKDQSIEVDVFVAQYAFDNYRNIYNFLLEEGFAIQNNGELILTDEGRKLKQIGDYAKYLYNINQSDPLNREDINAPIAIPKKRKIKWEIIIAVISVVVTIILWVLDKYFF
jgi:predicted transcriptional regulator